MIRFLLESLLVFALVCTAVCYCVAVAGGKQSRMEEQGERWTERDL